LKKLLLNKAILEQLFKENYKGLYYHALSFIKDEDASKDLVNDVFEYFWVNRKDIDISYSAKSLLYSMVRHKAINYLRHEDVKRKHMDFQLSHSSMEEKEYENYEPLINKIKLAIGNLPPQGRIVFEMYFIQNYSYKEVAEELDVSVNTVKTHISKSIKKLREQFSEEILLFLLFFEK
jgi:RNA polymerase sigma-70 factor (ECF subfamily)